MLKLYLTCTIATFYSRLLSLHPFQWGKIFLLSDSAYVWSTSISSDLNATAIEEGIKVEYWQIDMGGPTTPISGTMATPPPALARAMRKAKEDRHTVFITSMKFGFETVIEHALDAGLLGHGYAIVSLHSGMMKEFTSGVFSTPVQQALDSTIFFTSFGMSRENPTIQTLEAAWPAGPDDFWDIGTTGGSLFSEATYFLHLHRTILRVCSVKQKPYTYTFTHSHLHTFTHSHIHTFTHTFTPLHPSHLHIMVQRRSRMPATLY